MLQTSFPASGPATQHLLGRLAIGLVTAAALVAPTSNLFTAAPGGAGSSAATKATVAGFHAAAVSHSADREADAAALRCALVDDRLDVAGIRSSASCL